MRMTLAKRPNTRDVEPEEADWISWILGPILIILLQLTKKSDKRLPKRIKEVYSIFHFFVDKTCHWRETVLL